MKKDAKCKNLIFCNICIVYNRPKLPEPASSEEEWCFIKSFSVETRAQIPLLAKRGHEFLARKFLCNARPGFIVICHWNLELDEAPSIEDELLLSFFE